MLLNSIEYWAMNNPLRGYVQRHYEAPRLKRLSGVSAGDVLEIGHFWERGEKYRELQLLSSRDDREFVRFSDAGAGPVNRRL